MYRINTSNVGLKPDTCIWLQADVRGIYPIHKDLLISNNPLAMPEVYAVSVCPLVS